MLLRTATLNRRSFLLDFIFSDRIVKEITHISATELEGSYEGNKDYLSDFLEYMIPEELEKMEEIYLYDIGVHDVLRFL